jgi:hypothetical protein
MRHLSLIAVAAAAIGVSACTYVESQPQQQPQAVIVPQAAPVGTTTYVTPAPTVTVRPSY